MKGWGLAAAGVLLLSCACQTTAAPSPPAAGTAPAAASAPPTASPAAGSGSPAPPLEVVRVGSILNASDAPFYLAQERGYLREEGLEMEITQFDGAQRAIAPLGADQLDVAGGGPGPGLFNAIQRGIPLRIVADRSRAVPGAKFNCLVVRKALLDSGAVRSFADLRGRVFAENVPAVLTTALVERELRQAGVSPQELTWTVLSFSDMLNAFANEAVDAGVMVEPFVTVGEQRGVFQCWKPTGDMEPNFQIAVLLYGPVFAEQRRETARRFMVAYLRGVRDYYRAFFGDGQGRAEVLELISRVTGIRDLSLLDRISPAWMDPNGSVNTASLRFVQHWYLERGDLTGEVEVDQIVDPSFAEYALSRIGRYPTP
ncbi:MAG TPA: ABC transporter substrate-binding protein [Chloroflexota bacterium]|nr:ABC transporter substrate-binding protein [Chloroflexota bacterium]